MSRFPVVAIITDFGSKDSYVAQMKAVILSRVPETQIVDITHEVPPQDVAAAAYHLEVSYKYFPFGTVFLCVVDPGVGTERPAVALRAKRYYFVGPDNGLFGFLNKLGIDILVELDPKRISVESEISNTFHGRDLFAPAAAHLAAGRPLPRLGRQQNRLLKDSPMPEPAVENDTAKAQVVVADRFGNLITNFKINNLPNGYQVEHALCNGEVFKFVKTYANALPDEKVCLFGSSGRLELAVNLGSAASAIKASRGSEVIVRLKKTENNYITN